MAGNISASPHRIVRALVICSVAGAVTGASLQATAATSPTGGGASIVLEPAPAVPPARTVRPVFVCHDGAGVVFADRPCGQVLEARMLEVDERGAGEVFSIVPKPPAAAVRPRGTRERPARGPGSGDGRCERLRSQLDAIDDRMRAGYSAREAARLWNRWREVKAQIHAARC
jgi:hypothetical protein